MTIDDPFAETRAKLTEMRNEALDGFDSLDVAYKEIESADLSGLDADGAAGLKTSILAGQKIHMRAVHITINFINEVLEGIAL